MTVPDDTTPRLGEDTEESPLRHRPLFGGVRAPPMGPVPPPGYRATIGVREEDARRRDEAWERMRELYGAESMDALRGEIEGLHPEGMPLPMNVTPGQPRQRRSPRLRGTAEREEYLRRLEEMEDEEEERRRAGRGTSSSGAVVLHEAKITVPPLPSTIEGYGTWRLGVCSSILAATPRPRLMRLYLAEMDTFAYKDLNAPLTE